MYFLKAQKVDRILHKDVMFSTRSFKIDDYTYSIIYNGTGANYISNMGIRYWDVNGIGLIMGDDETKKEFKRDRRNMKLKEMSREDVEYFLFTESI